MFRHIKTIVAGDDPAIKNGKPAPDMYLEAAKRLGVDPSECLVFEDSMSGVKSGKAAGCLVVAIPDPRMDKDIFEAEANVVLDDLTQFDGRIWCIDINMKERSLLPN
jgi:beta-phosphoglucomutase-like phosphatase (HAD superfamily)